MLASEAIARLKNIIEHSGDHELMREDYEDVDLVQVRDITLKEHREHYISRIVTPESTILYYENGEPVCRNYRLKIVIAVG